MNHRKNDRTAELKKKQKNRNIVRTPRYCSRALGSYRVRNKSVYEGKQCKTIAVCTRVCVCVLNVTTIVCYYTQPK